MRKMIPTFLVAIILFAHVSARDECTGSSILYAPTKVYKSVHPLSSTDSVLPAGSMHKDIWYRVDLLEPYSFTFYGEQSDWALYRSASCDWIDSNSKVAGTGSSIPLILQAGTYFFRVGTLAPSPTVAPVYEYAFSVLNDYPVIGNVKTATNIILEPGSVRKDIAVPQFHYLTADVDGRDLNSQTILWDSSWYLITLPKMSDRSVTVFFHDRTAPGRDDYASIVMNFYKTPNQNSPSGPYTTYNSLIFTEQMSLQTQSSFYLQIGRKVRCNYITNYNLTVILQRKNPVTTGLTIEPELPITSAAVPEALPIPAPAGIPAIPKPELSPADFCTSKTWNNMDMFGLGYFCTDDIYYYRCDAQNRLNAKIKCPGTQRCRCSGGEECSLGGKRSPCK